MSASSSSIPVAQLLIGQTTRVPAVTMSAPSKSRPQRRRPTRQQGLALEKLGHAIEYLIDSQLQASQIQASQLHPAQTANSAAAPPSSASPNGEAARILMRLSREVFAECRPIPSTAETLRHLFHLFATR